MDNSINFRGAFIIKHPYADIIPKAALGSKNQVFKNFNAKGDTLYVVRDFYDKNIADIISATPNIKFKYYPTLNTYSGFDTQKTKEAKSILAKAAETAITAKNKLLAATRRPPKDLLETNIKRIQEKNLKFVKKEFFIDIDEVNYSKHIDVNTGICKILTKKQNPKTKKMISHTLVEISHPGKYGICYVTYTPVTTKELTRRWAIQNGEKIVEYPNSDSSTYIDSIKSGQKSISDSFRENATEAVKYYTETLKKNKEILNI